MANYKSSKGFGSLEGVRCTWGGEFKVMIFCEIHNSHNEGGK